jgi:hypothetical protein
MVTRPPRLRHIRTYGQRLRRSICDITYDAYVRAMMIDDLYKHEADITVATTIMKCYMALLTQSVQTEWN